MPAVETRRTPRTPRVAALAACAALLAIGGAELADGQDLQTQLSERQSELEGQRDRKGVLSTELAGYEDQLEPARRGGGDASQPRGDRGRRAPPGAGASAP